MHYIHFLSCKTMIGFLRGVDGIKPYFVYLPLITASHLDDQTSHRTKPLDFLHNSNVSLICVIIREKTLITKD